MFPLALSIGLERNSSLNELDFLLSTYPYQQEALNAILGFMKDLLIILGMCLLAIAIGAWLFLHDPARPLIVIPTGAPTASTPSTMEEPKDALIDFSVIDTGMHAAGVSSAKNYAAGGPEEFAKIWKMAHGDDGIPLPEVDFDKDYVIAVFAGQKPTGGYALEVSQVVDSKDTRTIAMTLTSPGKGCIVTQALTNPYQIITLPASTLTLKSVTVTKTVDCK